MRCRVLAGLVSLLLIRVPFAAAEDHGHFFFFGAPGWALAGGQHLFTGHGSSSDPRIHLGGGGEAAVKNIWGIGAEFGGVVAQRNGKALTLLSVNGFYHPAGQHHQPVDAYLTGGWSLSSGADHTASLLNVGAGFNRWLAAHRNYNLGLKFEVRDYVRGGKQYANYLEARIGMNIWQ